MRRQLDHQLNTHSASYYHDQTQGLVNAVTSRDFARARSLYTVILADIVGHNAEPEYVRTQLYDLTFMLSRLAIDSGVEPEGCMRLMTEYCGSERYTSSLQGLGYAASETADRLLGAMELAARPYRPAVEAMCGYIRSHLNLAFTLKDVADTVGLSPYYASRIFKEEMGDTIMEYATKARVNEAKYLLSNPKYRIDEIAAQLGYADPSYFGRVFKRHVGVSPRQYRMSH